MKTVLKISFALCLLLSFSACNLKDSLTKDVEINDKAIEFDLAPAATPVAAVSQPNYVAAANPAEIVLLDMELETGVAQKLKDAGLSVDLIKSFALTNAKLEVTVPEEYKDFEALLNSFQTIKLYFENQNQLIAEGKSVTITGRTGKVAIDIKNPELLSRLKEDKLRVILTGEKRPPLILKCKLVTSYKAKVGLN